MRTTRRWPRRARTRVWRASASFTLPVRGAGGRVLDLAAAPAAAPWREPVRVRVAEYAVDGEDSTPSEVFCLVTHLLDPAEASAGNSRGSTRTGGTTETVFRCIKTARRGGVEVVLRSKKPDGTPQEIWAILAVYQGLRHLICQAATAAGADPGASPSPGPCAPPAARPMARRPCPPERLAQPLRRAIRKLTARNRRVPDALADRDIHGPAGPPPRPQLPARRAAGGPGPAQPRRSPCRSAVAPQADHAADRDSRRRTRPGGNPRRTRRGTQRLLRTLENPPAQATRAVCAARRRRGSQFHRYVRAEGRARSSSLPGTGSRLSAPAPRNWPTRCCQSR